MPFREFGAFKLRKCRVCQLHSLTCVINVLHGVMVTTELYTACIISLGLDHCIAGDCNVHCESHLWLHPESARP